VSQQQPETATSATERIRSAKGDRPYFFPDPNLDKVVAMLTALVSEVAVLRERLDSHERLAESETWASLKQIEAYAAPDDVEADRAEWREAYVARVMRILTDELRETKPGT
jgi:hypothetical protein